MNSFLISLVFLSCLCFSYSLKWEGTNANGHLVERTFSVLKSPALGDPYTFAVLATQRSVNSKGHKSRIIDALEFVFSVVGLPHFVVRYFARSTDSIEAGAIRHGLRKLVEYFPGANASAGFEPGVNNISSIQYFWGSGPSAQWSQLSVVENTDSSSGANTYTVCSSNGIGVTICIYSTDIFSEMMINGSKFGIDPNSIHHSLNIASFPWTGTNTQLALKVHFEAISKVAELTNSSLLDTNEDALNLSDDSDTTKAYASWNKTVSVTGAGCSPTAPVVRSVIYENDPTFDKDVNVNTATGQWSGEVNVNFITRLVYYSFLTDCNQPTNILWDPDMGFVDSFASFVYPSLSLMLLALLSLLF